MTAAVPIRFPLRWIAIVIALLGVHIACMIWAAVIATGDPNFVVIPNYYERAVNWDREQALVRSSGELGWTVALEPMTGGLDVLNRRPMTLRLTEADGRPVAVESVSFSGYHEADGGHPFRATVKASAPGTFVIDLPFAAAGFYQFSLDTRRGADSFTRQWKQYLPAAQARP